MRDISEEEGYFMSNPDWTFPDMKTGTLKLTDAAKSNPKVVESFNNYYKKDDSDWY